MILHCTPEGGGLSISGCVGQKFLEYLHCDFNEKNALVNNVFGSDVKVGDEVGIGNFGQVRFGLALKF